MNIGTIAPARGTARAARNGRATAWLVFVSILCLHGVFVATYPLNSRGGDSANYYQMLVEGRSSLVHAGGYPFLVGLPFRRAPFAAMAADAPWRFETILQISQHGLLLGALVVLFLFLRRTYGSLTASLATLGLGLNQQLLGAASSTYPEWLQAVLLILAGCAAGHAYRHISGSRKILWYCVSITFFAWCFLVKFNAAVLAVMYLAPAIAERGTLLRKALCGVGCAAVAAGHIAVYQFAFHQPTTGTPRLTADTGWVLLTRIQSVYGNELLPSSGLETKRWLALASALPARYDVAGPGLFSHVGAVAPEVRAPYRPTFQRIVSADDKFLDAWLREHPLPPNFNVGVSVIPVCYYVGLFEGNDLGVKVAMEAVVSRPRVYIATVLRDVLAAVSTQQRYPLYPLPDNMPAFGFAMASERADGRTQLTQHPQPWNVPYGYRAPVVWWSGVNAFAWMSRYRVPAPLVSSLIALAILVAAVGSAVRRRIALEDGIALTLGICLVTLVVASCMTLEFRWKELCLAMPLISTLAALGATGPIRLGARLIHRIRRA